MIRHSFRFFAAAFTASALASVSVPVEAQQSRLLYAGFLEEAQVLTLNFDISAPGNASYSVAVAGDLIGMLAGMYPFHMQLSSEGRLNGPAAFPNRFRSDIAASDGSRQVTLTYGAGGIVQMMDQPPTEEGQAARARGLLNGTIDPLSAVAFIARGLAAGSGCSGRLPVFDGVRRFDLTLSPVPASAPLPRLTRVTLNSPPRGCDAALTLISGFPQSAVNSGMYPRTARFWFTAELNPTWPVLLRIDAESGLGHIRMEYVGAN
jgi:hypothetical protein